MISLRGLLEPLGAQDHAEVDELRRRVVELLGVEEAELAQVAQRLGRRLRERVEVERRAASARRCGSRSAGVRIVLPAPGGPPMTDDRALREPAVRTARRGCERRSRAGPGRLLVGSPSPSAGGSTLESAAWSAGVRMSAVRLPRTVRNSSRMSRSPAARSWTARVYDMLVQRAEVGSRLVVDRDRGTGRGGWRRRCYRIGTAIATRVTAPRVLVGAVQTACSAASNPRSSCAGVGLRRKPPPAMRRRRRHVGRRGGCRSKCCSFVDRSGAPGKGRVNQRGPAVKQPAARFGAAAPGNGSDGRLAVNGAPACPVRGTRVTDMRRADGFVAAMFAALVVVYAMHALSMDLWDDALFSCGSATTSSPTRVPAWNVADGPVHGNTSQLFRLRHGSPGARRRRPLPRRREAVPRGLDRDRVPGHGQHRPPLVTVRRPRSRGGPALRARRPDDPLLVSSGMETLFALAVLAIFLRVLAERDLREQEGRPTARWSAALAALPGLGVPRASGHERR